jgi:ATP-dependent RNA/DNA helicase IGHMBP2
MSLLCIESLPPRTSKGDVLRLLCSKGKLAREQVGRIEIHGTTAVIEVPDGTESQLANVLDGTALESRRLRVRAGGAATTVDSDDHFGRLATLLQLEADAEAKEASEKTNRPPGAGAESTGRCLVGMKITEESSGLGGRCVATLSKRDRSQELPYNRFEPGTPVLLMTEGTADAENRRGVVCERSRTWLSIAFSEPLDHDERAVTYRLDISSDEISRQRQLDALRQARAERANRSAFLRDVLLGEKPSSTEAIRAIEFLDPSLDPSQQSAIAFALFSRDVAVVHGPPGTGKTTALVELIRQAVRRGERVLACAPSNLAVDNLLERLLDNGENAIRIGHPARVTPALRDHTLDLLVEAHSDTRLARKLTRDAFALFRQAGKWTRAKPEPGARGDMRREAREMLADARRMEGNVANHILDSARIVCSTLTGLDSELLGDRKFELVVIDEAAQATEPACWPAVLRCQRLVLAGDHCQLPPTILSREADEKGLGISLMEHVVRLHGRAVTRRLDVQYRMNEAIMAFPSARFYDGALQAHSSVASHLLRGLPSVHAVSITSTPMEFIDTAGADCDETIEPGGESRRNFGEADLVCRKVSQLVEAGVMPRNIAVIAPYSAQVRLLRSRLDIHDLEIDSVDGFQGREKEAIIISLVRSNPEGEIGFLADTRRMNVAMTRARRKLLIVGNSATLSSHLFYRDLLSHVEIVGAYRSVWEEQS